MIDHAARRQGIGGSELAAILGLDPYRSPLDVWAVKKGLKPEFTGNAHTLRGQRFEDAVGEYLHDHIGREWKRQKVGLFTHPDYPWMLGHPDRIYKLRKLRKGGEIKTSIVTIKPEDLTDPTNPKKVAWVFQGNWYMGLTGIEEWHIGWMNPFWDFQTVMLRYQQPLFDAVTAHVADWWERHIVEGIQPEPSTIEDAAFLWPQDNGKSFEATTTLASVVDQYKELKAQSRALDAKMGEIYQSIALAFGPYETANYAGQRLASFKTNSKGVRTLRL